MMVLLGACGDPEVAAVADERAHRLAEQGETGELMRIIEDTGDPDRRDACYRTPLMLAAQSGRLATVRELITAGAGLDLGEKGNYTALMLAAGNGHAEVVSVLAKAGAKIDVVEITNGWSALIWAANRGHGETVQRLLALGADTGVRDHKGYTAADWARMQGHPRVAAILAASHRPRPMPPAGARQR